MAVSFNVPKSPKRDIFVIDNFMGVDLTNTGSNIDENKSPNAENMVRFVPGKVRKRTGYQNDAIFSDAKDVNRAKNTSEDWITLHPEDFDENGRCLISEFYDVLESTSCRYEVEAVGEYATNFYLTESNYTYWVGNHYTGTEENPYIDTRTWYNYTNNKTYACGIRRYSEGENDYIKLRRLQVCEDTEATSWQEFSVLPWTPAPEDNGCHFCKTEKSDPIYGVHILNNGNVNANRVVNVNRALGTSREFETFSITSTRSTLYELGEYIYRTADSYRLVNVYIDFDYILDGGDTFVQVADNGYGGELTLTDTGGETKHFSARIPTGSYYNKRVTAGTGTGTSDTATLQVKNLTVCYQKDDNYKYSPAPEDSGGTFNTEDIYYIGRENHAIIDSFTHKDNIAGTWVLGRATITDANTGVYGFVRVSFDVHTYSSKAPTQVKIQLTDQNYALVYEEDFNANLDTRHFDWYVSAGASDKYITDICVTQVFASGGGDFQMDISNIEVNEISPKKSYDISAKNYIYHVGSDFWFRPNTGSVFTKIYAGANSRLSRSWQLNDNIYIIDGQDIYTYSVGEDHAVSLSEIAYVPIVTIAKAPAGGGTQYEPINMLQPGFYELFGVDEAHKTAVNFQLSFGQLDQKETQAWVMDGNGNWVRKKEGTDYSVNRGAGTITFNTAPGKTPIAGEDNVKILAYRTVPGYADRVKKCTVGALFGVGGAGDRLFLSGNPDKPNWDFYSQQFDPSYFPDTGYSVLGSASSSIMGYAIINNYLTAFKDDFDSSQSAFVREGDWVVDSATNLGEPAFKLINTLQGNGVVAPYSFGYLQTEPLFLTRSGIYAITVQDITGDKYSQNRSFYLDGQLTKEENLETAVATVYKDQYVLAVNNKLYILDGLQPIRTDKSAPYSTRQYAGFYCTNVPALCIWTDENVLFFGTSDGKVCRFATNIEALESYNDNGEPIECCWETPDLDGKLFYKNKTFRYFAIRMMSAIRTSVELWSNRLGSWFFIKEDTSSGVVFDFDSIDFEAFSFSTDTSEKVAFSKIRVKKVDKARFRVENKKLNEPFGLFDLALEYIESGNYKG